MPQQSHPLRRSAYKLLATTRVFFAAAGLLLLAFVPAITQQQSDRPERGVNDKGGLHVGDVDAISLQSGAVNLSIPLASLPPMAGGKMGYTLNAYYNSKLWDIHRAQQTAPPTGGAPGCPNLYTTGTVMEADNGGWQIGGTYNVFFRDARDGYEYVTPESFDCWGYEYYNMNGAFFKPILRTPDGAEHEMRIEGSFATYSNYGTSSFLMNYYKFSGSGSVYSPGFTSPVRMSTIDGTYYTAVYNPSSYSTKWIIYAPDGTRVQQDSDGQRVIDTNGNSILFNGPNGFAEDEATGRVIKAVSTTYGGQPAIAIQYQSTGGSWQSVYIVYGTTTVQGKYYQQTGWNDIWESECYYAQGLISTPLNVVRRIVFPAAESGVDPPEYDFAYNSDSSSSVTTSLREACNSSASNVTRTTSYGWGELSSMTTPTGAQSAYSYTLDGVDSGGLGGGLDQDAIVKDTVTAKSVMHDGTTDNWAYTLGSVTNPDGSTHTEDSYSMDLAGQVQSVDYAGHTYRSVDHGVMTEKTWTNLAGAFYQFGSNGGVVQGNPVVDTEYTTLLDTDNTRRLKMSAKKYSYDYNGNVTQEIDYDWFDPSSVGFGGTYGLPTGVPSGAAVLRVVNNTYYNDASSSSSSNSYRNRTVGSGSTVILGKIKETTVGDGTTVKGDTRYSYDGNSWGTAPSVGNLTTTSVYNDTASAWINTTATYDSHGNVTATTDGNGNTTAITYGSVGGYTGLYPTQVVQAYGTSVARTMQTGYDFYTGLQTSVTDADNSVTTTTAYDILLRPTLVKNAYGTSLENWVQTDYHDHDRFVVTKADLVSAGDGKKVATKFFDQLGRVRLAKTLEDASTQSATNETDGIKVETHYATASGYTYQLTSNPYRASSASAASGEETMGWTRTKAWATGRESQVETFSGSSMPSPWGSNTSSTGVVQTDIASNATTMTDQASKVRRSLTDGLGRLVRVDEPTSGGLGTVSSPNQYTSYTYDVLNNLTGVSQGSQTRSFSYNSLARLTSATNPESGTIGYVYDNNGNLTSKTDARSITTSYAYDALNRLTQKSYSDSSPSSIYTYDDSSVTYSKGRLTKVLSGTTSSPISVTEYKSFDALGGVLSHRQTTNGTSYDTTYTYTLGGELLDETYPSGRVVRNNLDGIGRLSSVQSKPSGGSFANYASNFSWNSVSFPTAIQLGNGRWESLQMNSRMQPTEVALGTSSGATDLLKLDFGYGTTQNSGNVLSQTITVPTVGSYTGFTATQAYSYDELNRLHDATETISSSQVWKQTFSYDRYGNRTFDEANTTTLTKSCGGNMCSSDRKVENPSVVATTNRFTADQDGDSVDDYTFDSNGSLTKDALGRTFTYDGRNKATQVKNSSNVTIGQYTYDGDQKRVIKSASGDNTIFVYDAFGKLVEEYPTSTPTTVGPSYVYAGSRVLATLTGSATSYLTPDHLGTPRIATDANGAVLARHDYFPFGQEIASSQRIGGLGYSIDSVRQRFTGYEMDGETTLDFAQARYYSPQVGRFYSVDPSAFSAHKSNPQTLNRFAYVLNNPLNATDPSGLDGDDKKNKGCVQVLGPDVEQPSCGGGGKKKGWLRRAWDGFWGHVIPTAHAQSEDDIEEPPAQREPPKTRREREEFERFEGIEPREEIVRRPLTSAEKTAGYMRANPGTRPEDVPCFANDPEPTASMGNPNDPGPIGPPSPPTPSAEEIIEGLFANPQSIRGETPQGLITRLGPLPTNWRQETLRQGSQQGNGLVLREYAPNGRETGRFISWHPGGGHHGPDPYWKVTSGETGTHRIQ